MCSSGVRGPIRPLGYQAWFILSCRIQQFVDGSDRLCLNVKPCCDLHEVPVHVRGRALFLLSLKDCFISFISPISHETNGLGVSRSMHTHLSMSHSLTSSHLDLCNLILIISWRNSLGQQADPVPNSCDLHHAHILIAFHYKPLAAHKYDLHTINQCAHN